MASFLNSTSMNRISRYIFSQLMLSVLFSCLAIAVVVWFSQSIRLLSLVINNGASLWAFFKLMLLIFPTFMPLVLPLSLMAGALFVYHRLIIESEMHVMQAMGLSPMVLARPAILSGLIVAALAYFFAMVVAPWANGELVKLKYNVINDHSLLLLRTGSFHDINKRLTFYARDRSEKGELRGILIHDTSKPDRPVTIMAESGELVQAPEGPRILVKKGTRQDVAVATGVLSQLSFDTYLVDLSGLSEQGKSRWREPRERSMAELINPQGNDRNPLTIRRFLSEFHWRMTMPFLSITFVMIACTGLLTGRYDRHGVTNKIVIASAVVIGMEALMLTLLNIVNRHSGFAILLYLVTLLPPVWMLQRLAQKGRAA